MRRIEEAEGMEENFRSDAGAQKMDEMKVILDEENRREKRSSVGSTTRRRDT